MKVRTEKIIIVTLDAEVIHDGDHLISRVLS